MRKIHIQNHKQIGLSQMDTQKCTTKPEEVAHEGQVHSVSQEDNKLVPDVGVGRQHFSSSPNLLPCNSWPMFLTPLSLQNIVYSSYLFQDLACHLSAVSLRNISMICFINPLSSLSNSKPVTDGYSLSCSISAWYFSHVLEIPS